MPKDRLRAIIEGNARLGALPRLSDVARELAAAADDVSVALDTGHAVKAHKAVGSAMLTMSLLIERYSNETGRNPWRAGDDAAELVLARIEHAEKGVRNGLSAEAARKAAVDALP